MALILLTYYNKTLNASIELYDFYRIQWVNYLNGSDFINLIGLDIVVKGLFFIKGLVYKLVADYALITIKILIYL